MNEGPGNVRRPREITGGGGGGARGTFGLNYFVLFRKVCARVCERESKKQRPGSVRKMQSKGCIKLWLLMEIQLYPLSPKPISGQSCQELRRNGLYSTKTCPPPLPWKNWNRSQCVVLILSADRFIKKNNLVVTITTSTHNVVKIFISSNDFKSPRPVLFSMTHHSQAVHTIATRCNQFVMGAVSGGRQIREHKRKKKKKKVLQRKLEPKGLGDKKDILLLLHRPRSLASTTLEYIRLGVQIWLPLLSLVLGDSKRKYMRSIEVS